jgi:hypothetical protein
MSDLTVGNMFVAGAAFVEQGNPAGPGDITPNRSTSVATAATDASHFFETYPVDATAV